MTARRGYAYNFPGHQHYSDRRIWRYELLRSWRWLAVRLRPYREIRRLRADNDALRHVLEHPEMIQHGDDG